MQIDVAHVDVIATQGAWLTQLIVDKEVVEERAVNVVVGELAVSKEVVGWDSVVCEKD